MTRTFRTLIAGAALLAPAYVHTAYAQSVNPRVVGSGENQSVAYGAGPGGSVTVGGGHAVVVGSGENRELRYLGPTRAQPSHDHLVPVVVGSGENVSVVHVPAETAGPRLAQMGGDGSVPAGPNLGRGLLARLFNGGTDRG